MENLFDMIVVGGGPGGYTAALYGARAGLRVLVLEKSCPGGQMALTGQVDNYPGFEAGAAGFDLGVKFRAQAERFGAVTVMAEAAKVDVLSAVKSVETKAGTFFGKTLVYAAGADPRRLGLPKERELTGQGVHYCAECDGMFYRGRTVAVVGGGSSAVAEALHLSRLAEKVYLIHRRDTLRAAKIDYQALQEAQNIVFLWNSQVQELLADDRLTGIRVRNTQTGETAQIPCGAVFVSIGRDPATALVRGQLKLDEQGYIIAGESTQTEIPGVYAVGDVRTKQLRQIVTAVADGAAAAFHAAAFADRWQQ